MVCPICITTAVVANLPVISTSLGGVVASKVAYKHLMKKNANIKKNEAIMTSRDIAPVQQLEVVSLSKTKQEDTK